MTFCVRDSSNIESEGPRHRAVVFASACRARRQKNEGLHRHENAARKRGDAADVARGDDTKNGDESPQRHLIRIAPCLRRPIDGRPIERAIVGYEKAALDPDHHTDAEEQGDERAKQSGRQKESEHDQHERDACASSRIGRASVQKGALNSASLPEKIV